MNFINNSFANLQYLQYKNPPTFIGRSLNNPNLINSNSLTSLNSANNNSDLQTINHSQTANDDNSWTWQDIRKTIGDVIPPLATLFLTIASFLSGASFLGGASFLESIIEPISSFFNWTSLLVIASDLPSIFEGMGESLQQVKEIISHPSFKGLVYVFSKIIPLYFIAEIFAGRNLLGRILKGEKIAQKGSLFSKLKEKRSLTNFASMSEAVKAQFLNLGGNSLLRTLTWFARRAVIGHISHLPFIKLKDHKKIETLIQSLATLWLALASSLLPRSQYKVNSEDLQ